MPIPDYVRRIRRKVDHDLVLLPTVAVLPRDQGGRILLVRQADTGRWGTIGGAIEVDESPRDAALREAKEEAGIVVELGRIVDVIGGPEYRITYPNGDRVACVSIVYDATVTSGRPAPDGDETTEVGWFAPEQLASADLGPFARATFGELGLM